MNGRFSTGKYCRAFHDFAARGLSLFIGGFLIVNLSLRLKDTSLDATNLLFDASIVPETIRSCMFLFTGIVLVRIGFCGRGNRIQHAIDALALMVLLIVALANTGVFYYLLLVGKIQTPTIVPFSIIIAALLAGILIQRLTAASCIPRLRNQLSALAGAGVCALTFPLALMFCFGRTNYARSADAIVVFGARAYADGRPSDALADRVRTACDLYHEGLSPTLIFSGGPGDGDIHETEAMRRMAIELGVPDEDIILDTNGLSTQLTVDNCSASLGNSSPRILAVSHAYHLPRVKMAFERAGVRTYTVPAHETYMLTQMPIFMAREVGAYWKYYFTS